MTALIWFVLVASPLLTCAIVLALELRRAEDDDEWGQIVATVNAARADVEAAALTCSAEGCDTPAAETLFLRDQVGHVHDCTTHAAVLREWCDVVHGEPLVDGECMAAVCTDDAIWIGQPKPLGED